VEKQDEFDAFELTGVITSFDATAQTFRFGLLTIDFSAAIIEGAPAAASPTTLRRGRDRPGAGRR
jgi:hypothetical protein